MTRVAIVALYAAATVSLAILFLVGVGLTALYRRYGWPEQGDKGNCWAYAVPHWLRSPVKSCIAVSLSPRAPVPHVRYVPSLDGVAYEEFVPNESRRGWRGVLHSFWFDGHVKRG
jgi:hypothetical protein